MYYLFIFVIIYFKINHNINIILLINYYKDRIILLIKKRESNEEINIK